jgi:ABC-type sugar transport system permease subunit
MSGVELWVTVIVASLVVLGIKVAGWALPAKWFSNPRVAPIAGLVTAALLAGLTVVQGFASGTRLVFDSRVAALAVAAVAYWRRVPFILVVILAAAVAAGLRALGLP